MVNPLEQMSLPALRERTSLKWREYPADVLPLWVAEMDVATPEPVVAAVEDAMRRGDTGYPSGTGYAEALAVFAADRWGWRFDPSHTALVPDVMIGITEVLALVTDPGDAVVVTPPIYPPFFAFVEHAGRRIVEAPLGTDARLDPEALAAAMRTATGEGRRAAMLLCNPHNPTGVAHTADELATVAALAREHGVSVVADEIHAPVVHGDSPHVPYLSVPGAENGFSLLSASKAWNLAGLKAAVAVAGPESVGALRTMPEIVWHGASHVAVIAHTAAFTDGTAWLDDLRAGIRRNHRLLADLLAQHLPEVRHEVPAATYLAWLDCTGLELSDDPAAFFLREARVAVNPGPAFGTGGSGHVRLNVATSSEILTTAVQQMAAAVHR